MNDLKRRERVWGWEEEIKDYKFIDLRLNFGAVEYCRSKATAERLVYGL
jgi:hypothetical protein